MSRKKKKTDHPAEVVPHSKMKRSQMTSPANSANGYTEPVTLDGNALPSGEGWMRQIPDDKTLYVAGVKNVRMSDGSAVKFYRMMVKKDEVKRLRKQTKKKLQRIACDDREHAKRDVRALLVLLGKS